MKGVFINHELVSGKKTLNVGDELGIGSHQYTGRECFIFKLFKIDDMEVEVTALVVNNILQKLF